MANDLVDKIKPKQKACRLTQHRLNRQLSMRAMTHHRLKRSKSLRTPKTPTRNLIQIGSLINITGAPELFNIKMSDNLSATLSNKDEAAVFLGFFMDIKHKVLPALTYAKIETWQHMDIQLLEERSIKNKRKSTYLP